MSSNEEIRKTDDYRRFYKLLSSCSTVNEINEAHVKIFKDFKITTGTDTDTALLLAGNDVEARLTQSPPNKERKGTVKELVSEMKKKVMEKHSVAVDKNGNITGNVPDSLLDELEKMADDFADKKTKTKTAEIIEKIKKGAGKVIENNRAVESSLNDNYDYWYRKYFSELAKCKSVDEFKEKYLILLKELPKDLKNATAHGIPVQRNKALEDARNMAFKILPEELAECPFCHAKQYSKNNDICKNCGAGGLNMSGFEKTSFEAARNTGKMLGTDNVWLNRMLKQKAAQKINANSPPSSQSNANPYLARYCPKCHTQCEVLDRWGYKYRCPTCNNTLKASETLSLGDLRRVDENKEHEAHISREAKAHRHIGEGIEQFVRGAFGEKSYIRYNNAAKDASYYEEVSKHVRALFKNRINFKVWKLYPLNMNILPMLGGHDLEVRMVFGRLDIELINEFARTGTNGVDLNANLVNRINWLKRAQKYVSVEYLSELLNTLNADKFMVTEFKVDENIGSVTLKFNHVGYAVPLDRVEAPEHGKPKWADWDVPVTPRMKKPSIWEKIFGKKKKKGVKPAGEKAEGTTLLKIISSYWANILILLLGWGLFYWELRTFGGGDFGGGYLLYAIIGSLIGLFAIGLEIKEKLDKANEEKKTVENIIAAEEGSVWSAHPRAETARKEKENEDDGKDEEPYTPKKQIKDAVLPGTPSAAAEMLKKQEEEE